MDKGICNPAPSVQYRKDDNMGQLGLASLRHMERTVYLLLVLSELWIFYLYQYFRFCWKFNIPPKLNLTVYPNIRKNQKESVSPFFSGAKRYDIINKYFDNSCYYLEEQEQSEQMTIEDFRFVLF